MNEELNSKDASNKDSGSLEDGLRKDLVTKIDERFFFEPITNFKNEQDLNEM